MRRARELQIKSRVNFLGVRRDIPTLVANASILASTSKIESFGLTIAEGMSCETPVFAPNIGGIPEICLDGENGLLFDLTDMDNAVDRLAKLMENEKLRKNLGLKGRKRVLEHFSPKPIVEKYDQVYHHALNL
jgi:glycosyltransferase involved in cell wall biosynthesis